MDQSRPNIFLERKIQKKLSRGLQLINKDLNSNLQLILQLDGISSKNVVIINGGFTTGLDETTLLNIFNEAGFNDIEKIIILPHKHYSFISFSEELEASRAVHILSGIIKIPGTNHPLYLGCVSEVPKMNDNVIFKDPPGLKIYEDFITKEEEATLANLIPWEIVPSLTFEGSTLKNRQVRHFGYEFKYGSNSIDINEPLPQGIPGELNHICERFVDGNMMDVVPDQLTVNKYSPGQGIPPHVDTHQHFTGELLSLSILGGVTMDFYCDLDASETDKHQLHYAVYLPPRSLCVMSGPSRYQWMHGICSRKTDIVPDCVTKKLTLKPRSERVSFTFRKLKEDGPCKCSYPLMCDSQLFKKDEQQKMLQTPLKNVTAAELENEHVLKVYENIADHFSETRHKPWPKVTEFVGSQPVGAVMLDAGCGNGKYLSNGRKIFQIGCDTSLNLLGICVERQFEVALSNCLSLPFKSSSFDAVICIAVIHHLASQDRRLKAVEEILRVLRAGGQALVYVWAMEQKREKMSTYLKQKRSNRRDLRKNINCNSETFNSCSDELASAREAKLKVADISQFAESEGCEEVSTEKVSSAVADNLSSSEKQNERVLNKLLIHENRTEFVDQDMFVPWKIKPKKFQSKANRENSKNVSSDTIPTFHRFYHVFKEGELESLFVKFPNVRIIKSYYDEGNWCIIAEKINMEYAHAELDTESKQSVSSNRIRISGNDDSNNLRTRENDDSEHLGTSEHLGNSGNNDSKHLKTSENNVECELSDILSRESAEKLLALHEVECKAEQLAKFIVSVMSDCPDLQPTDDIEETLLRCTKSMISQHESIFKDLVNKLRVCNETAYAAFLTVVNELFEGEKSVISWGRIIALYAFGGQLALYCNENCLIELQKEIPVFLRQFAKISLSHFVLREGGWEHICKVYPANDYKADSKMWKLLTWTTVGLCFAGAASFLAKH